ncbi:hypothetical protein AMAG_18564 [Allomyces macrogynus ATCC 38327]|uniref:Uncharacterized protein n=1 Tax=Allomyces macrogynus (strain ATCC 38327) TaxID=578462 RepID=A0A0L0SDY6_ALLM3|nr:hypothetical protein AMAG_18564 [Allomyces macrogynus ATCC 38327]|eukprot:KNE60600.1 hypothetical protein AMAG_18564 [Allomyces macrogynus ATCC 38327]
MCLRRGRTRRRRRRRRSASGVRPSRRPTACALIVGRRRHRNGARGQRAQRRCAMRAGCVTPRRSRRKNNSRAKRVPLRVPSPRPVRQVDLQRRVRRRPGSQHRQRKWGSLPRAGGRLQARKGVNGSGVVCTSVGSFLVFVRPLIVRAQPACRANRAELQLEQQQRERRHAENKRSKRRQASQRGLKRKNNLDFSRNVCRGRRSGVGS